MARAKKMKNEKSSCVAADTSTAATADKASESEKNGAKRRGKAKEATEKEKNPHTGKFRFGQMGGWLGDLEIMMAMGMRTTK